MNKPAKNKPAKSHNAVARARVASALRRIDHVNADQQPATSFRAIQEARAREEEKTASANSYNRPHQGSAQARLKLQAMSLHLKFCNLHIIVNATDRFSSVYPNFRKEAGLVYRLQASRTTTGFEPAIEAIERAYPNPIHQDTLREQTLTHGGENNGLLWHEIRDHHVPLAVKAYIRRVATQLEEKRPLVVVWTVKGAYSDVASQDRLQCRDVTCSLDDRYGERTEVFEVRDGETMFHVNTSTRCCARYEVREHLSILCRHSIIVKHKEASDSDSPNRTTISTSRCEIVTPDPGSLEGSTSPGVYDEAQQGAGVASLFHPTYLVGVMARALDLETIRMPNDSNITSQYGVRRPHIVGTASVGRSTANGSQPLQRLDQPPGIAGLFNDEVVAVMPTPRSKYHCRRCRSDDRNARRCSTQLGGYDSAQLQEGAYIVGSSPFEHMPEI
ncbi:hypothetical protein PybrP1_004684 [[Pythium] brassicae (nom. inval.)]|nr:hypothetical protein PybrP1_004684 [[Pythium] brassicae (nom. inval.)]